MASYLNTMVDRLYTALGTVTDTVAMKKFDRGRKPATGKTLVNVYYNGEDIVTQRIDEGGTIWQTKIKTRFVIRYSTTVDRTPDDSAIAIATDAMANKIEKAIYSNYDRSKITGDSFVILNQETERLQDSQFYNDSDATSYNAIEFGIIGIKKPI